tara:strand:- start:8 stop:916 length:909 start_codon:yes stop_codon:yes gene_type:complete
LRRNLDYLEKKCVSLEINNDYKIGKIIISNYSNKKSNERNQNGHLITVKKVKRITPNMLRVTFYCPSLEEMDSSRQGAHCKILLPKPKTSLKDFKEIISIKPKDLRIDERPARRTYTVRFFRKESMEMDIDFVDHGDEGPASSWARNAKQGSYVGLLGPAFPKIRDFYADWYLVAADMSALPVAAATIEAMPINAKGVAVFEITSESDKQDIKAPPGIKFFWINHPNAHSPSIAQLSFIKELEWKTGIVQTCIAGESGLIKQLRNYLIKEKFLPNQDTYISGYWKIGLIEDEHQIWKNSQNN